MIELEGAEISEPGYFRKNGGYVTAISTTGENVVNPNLINQTFGAVDKSINTTPHPIPQNDRKMFKTSENNYFTGEKYQKQQQLNHKISKFKKVGTSLYPTQFGPGGTNEGLQVGLREGAIMGTGQIATSYFMKAAKSSKAFFQLFQKGSKGVKTQTDFINTINKIGNTYDKIENVTDVIDKVDTGVKKGLKIEKSNNEKK